MLREDRDALLYIPESASKFVAAPLVVSLHGATRNADRGIDLLRSLSDEHGFVLLAPADQPVQRGMSSKIAPWGPDVAFINQSLARTFELRKYRSDAHRDGGVLGRGVVLALDRSLQRRPVQRSVRIFARLHRAGDRNIGNPPIFISHGTIDNVLPHRRVQPPHRAAIAEGWLSRDLSGNSKGNIRCRLRWPPEPCGGLCLA